MLCALNLCKPQTSWDKFHADCHLSLNNHWKIEWSWTEFCCLYNIDISLPALYHLTDKKSKQPKFHTKTTSNYLKMYNILNTFKCSNVDWYTVKIQGAITGCMCACDLRLVIHQCLHQVTTINKLCQLWKGCYVSSRLLRRKEKQPLSLQVLEMQHTSY